MCQNCNKKLGVPQEAHQQVVKVESEQPVLAIVASSSLSPSAPAASATSSVIEDEVEMVAKPVESDDEILSPEPEIEAAKSNEEHKHMHVPHGHFAHLGFSLFTKLVIWTLSVGFGFTCVVVLPRVFGLGFHAIDFVDVITQTGIGKYKVVVYLVVLWSLATACFVGVFNYVFNKLRRSR